MPGVPVVRRLAAMCLVVTAGCSGGTAPTTTSAAPRSAAIDYAASADRALDGTRFADVLVGIVADVVVGVCTSPDPTDAAIAAAIGAVDAPAGPAVDDAILIEVLTEGVREVCPDRAGASALIAAYLAAVHDAITSTDAMATIDDDAVLTAGPVACNLLDRNQGAESALLGVVATLFGVEADAIEGIDAELTPSQGVIAGATLGAAVAYLCSSHQAEVAAYLQSLGS